MSTNLQLQRQGNDRSVPNRNLHSVPFPFSTLRKRLLSRVRSNSLPLETFLCARNVSCYLPFVYLLEIEISHTRKSNRQSSRRLTLYHVMLKLWTELYDLLLGNMLADKLN